MTSARTRSGGRGAQRGRAPRGRRRPPPRPTAAAAAGGRSRACRRCRPRPGSAPARRALAARPREPSSAGSASAASASGSQRSASSTKAPPPLDRSAPVGARRAIRSGRQVRRGRAGAVTVNVLPRPRRALDPHRAAVQPHQLLDQRQADAGALVGARARVLRRGGSARRGAAISRRRRCRCRCRGPSARRGRPATDQLDRDLPLEGELERVREEVEDDLLPHLAVDVDRRPAAGQSTSNASPARSIADRKTLASSAVSAARSVGS